jgi:hypothetical protein
MKNITTSAYRRQVETLIKRYRRQRQIKDRRSRTLFNKCNGDQVAQDEWDLAWRCAGESDVYSDVISDLENVLNNETKYK